MIGKGEERSEIMRVNILQHTPNESPGYIYAWAEKNRYEAYVYHPYYFQGNLPLASETDLLVILGGPMNPNDSHLWLKEERSLILEMKKHNKPILGICLGAQQIAKALGAEIREAPYKEVGWAPVYLRNNLIPGIPDSFTVLHWHQDMFELPYGSNLLFQGKLVRNQGFLLDNIIGLQFHIEPSQNEIRELIVNDSDYPLKNNSLSQDAGGIIKDMKVEENKVILFRLLDYITHL